MASVPTGTPPGIWTIESSESSPPSAWLSTGTPSTGTSVEAAMTPGRWAAPPAPAMITSMPRPSAAAAYSAVSAGVRWAERTRHSCGTPNRSRVSSAWRMVSQSDLLPMMTATSGLGSELIAGVPPSPQESMRAARDGVIARAPRTRARRRSAADP